MKKRHMLNLQQKLIKISKKLPKLIKKHYSDEVDYDFVKIDDIYEIINPAFAKYHICIQEMEEKDSKTEFKDGRWIYTSELYFCLVNADQPAEREQVHIHLIGDHEDSPAKAQGAAWTYGLKHFLLYKFQIKQVSEDPDMKGKPAGGASRQAEITNQTGTGRTASGRRKDTDPKKAPSDVVGKSPLYGRLAEDAGERKNNAGDRTGNGDSSAKQMISAAPDPAEIFGKTSGDTTECGDKKSGTEQELAEYPASDGKEVAHHPNGDGESGGAKETAPYTSSGKGRVIPMPGAEKVVQGSFRSTDETSRQERKVPDEPSGSSVNPKKDETPVAQNEPQEAGSDPERVPDLPEQKAEESDLREEELPAEKKAGEQVEAVSGEKKDASSGGDGTVTVNEDPTDPDDRKGKEPIKEDGEIAEPAKDKEDDRREEQDAPDSDKVHDKERRKRKKGRHHKEGGGEDSAQMSLLDFAGSFRADEESTGSVLTESEAGEEKKANTEGSAPESVESRSHEPENRIDGLKEAEKPEVPGDDRKDEAEADVPAEEENADTSGTDGSSKDENGFAEAEEVPFDEADEEDFFKALEEEIRDEEETPLTLEEALQTICPYALFAGKTFEEMLKSDSGRKQLSWFATEYMGSDFRVRDAAKMVLENLEQKAA